MYKIDDLITEIHAEEAIELPGGCSKEQQERIEQKVISRITIEMNDKEFMGDLSDLHNGILQKRHKFPRRKRHIILLAATLILALGLTAFASKEKEWDIMLINFMGLNKSDVLQLEGGEVVINKKATSRCIDYANNPKGEEKEISITGITSIGDKNSAYLRVNTDYNLPEKFDESTEYILPENSMINITHKNVFGNQEIHTFGSVFTAFYEDGKLGFLISIENCEDINRCNVELKIENLYWYHDLGQHEENEEEESGELLCEGVWEMDWTYSYKSNVREKHFLKKIDTEEGKIYLTKVEVSPISLRIEAIRNPKDREKPWTIGMLEEVRYEDGTKVEIEGAGSGGIRNGIFIEEFANAYNWGNVLQTNKIKCVKVCGQDVEM